MHGELSFFEIPVIDTGRARTFYGGLFGWELVRGNFPNSFMLPTLSPPGAVSGDGTGSSPRVYFTVDDLEAAIANVRELGGHAGDPVDIPSGRFARCRDDQGTEFSLWWEPAR